MCMSMHPVVTRTRHWCISIRKVKFSRSLCRCRPFRSDGVNSDLVPGPLARPRPPTGTGGSVGRIGRTDLTQSHTQDRPPREMERRPPSSGPLLPPSCAQSRALAPPRIMSSSPSLHTPNSIPHTYTPRTRCNTARTLAIPRAGPLQWSTPQSRREQDLTPNEPQWGHIHTYVQNTHRK